MRIDCLPARELSSDLVSRWDQIVRETAELSSPYFRPEFFQAISRLRPNVEFGILRDNGEIVGFFPFERIQGSVARPVGGRLSDYQAVIAGNAVAWHAADLMKACRLRAWEFDHQLATQRQLKSHFATVANSWRIDASRGIEKYLAERKAAGAEALNMRLRKFRKLNREHRVRFEWNIADESAFKKLLAWKSEQYRRTGLTDLFAYSWVVALLKDILTIQQPAFAGVLSVLYVDDVPAAVHFGMRSQSELHYWFPAYDTSFGKYSPGSALLLSLIEHAGKHGVTRIDLGKGDDDYKLTFANDSVELADGVIETRPLVAAFRRGWAKSRELIHASSLRSYVSTPIRWLRRVREWRSLR